jgi:hypothetical protein
MICFRTITVITLQQLISLTVCALLGQSLTTVGIGIFTKQSNIHGYVGFHSIKYEYRYIGHGDDTPRTF